MDAPARCAGPPPGAGPFGGAALFCDSSNPSRRNWHQLAHAGAGPPAASGSGSRRLGQRLRRSAQRNRPESADKRSSGHWGLCRSTAPTLSAKGSHRNETQQSGAAKSTRHDASKTPRRGRRARPPPEVRSSSRQRRQPDARAAARRLGPRGRAVRGLDEHERDRADELGRRLGPRAAPSRFEEERPAPEC